MVACLRLVYFIVSMMQMHASKEALLLSTLSASIAKGSNLLHSADS
jgi:hypothetical protein